MDNVNSFELRFLTANDVYRPNKFSVMKTLKAKYQGIGITKCVLPGDFLGGSLYSVSHLGESMLEVCNEVGFDYVTLGNHEFDFGSTVLEKLIEKSNFKWLGSNVRYSDSGDIFSKVSDYDVFLLPPSTLTPNGHDVDVDALRVGVFGLCTQDTPTLSSPTDAVKFESPYAHAKRLVAHLKARERCDVIIALTHLPLAEDRELADANLATLILGGHEHEVAIEERNGVLIVKCGQNLDHLGVIDLHITCTKTGNHREVIIQHSLQLVSTHSALPDPGVDAVIHKWQSSSSSSGNVDRVSEGSLHEVLTTVSADGPLSTRTADCRRRETAFACYLADAYVWLFQTKLKSSGFQCDCAIQNGGFVRGDNSYPAGTDITRAIVAEELPFDRVPVLLEMTGAEILLALNEMLPDSATANSPIGRYPQLSSDFSVAFSLARPFSPSTVNDRLNVVSDGNPGWGRVISAKIKGNVLDPKAVYRVATTSFYHEERGDGVTAFTGRQLLCRHNQRCCDVMTEYLRTQESISGTAPGRLVQLAADPN